MAYSATTATAPANPNAYRDETWDQYATRYGVPVTRPTDPLGGEAWDREQNIYKMRQLNQATGQGGANAQNMAQWQSIGPRTAPKYVNGAAAAGYAGGGFRSQDGQTWNFIDNTTGQVLTSIPYSEYMTKYYDQATGRTRDDVESINGVKLWSYKGLQEQIRQADLLDEALANAKASPYAAVNTGNGTGNWMYDPVTGKFKNWGGSEAPAPLPSTLNQWNSAVQSGTPYNAQTGILGAQQAQQSYNPPTYQPQWGGQTQTPFRPTMYGGGQWGGQSGGLLGGSASPMGQGSTSQGGGVPSMGGMGQPLGQYTGGYANGKNTFSFSPFGMNSFFQNFWGHK